MTATTPNRPADMTDALPSRGPWPAAGMPASAPALTFAWLVRLRWGAVAAQAATVLVARRVLAVPLVLPWLVTLIAVSGVTNAGLFLWVRAGRPATHRAIGAILVVDTALLTGVLYLSGGPSNPFSILYLVYVTLGAVTLGIGWAATLVVVAALGYALLFSADGAMGGMSGMAHHHAMDGHAMGGSAYSTHLQAMWVAFAVAATLIAYFGSRVAHALRDREVQLADAQRVAARSKTVASLSSLAAGAAHELGTPLATIAVAAHELELALQKVDLPTLTADARLIREALERCRRIVEEMSGRSGETMGEMPRPVSLDRLVEDLRGRVTGWSHAPLDVTMDPAAPGPVTVPVRGLAQALASLLRNAFDASQGAGPVRLDVLRRGGRLRFDVIDEGPGIPRAILDRVGEPFFTTKASGQGMGLGVFLAQAFAERWNGRVWIESEVGTGTRAHLEIPFQPTEGT
jgi:two-component system, sensor histidine kinase RegB